MAEIYDAVNTRYDKMHNSFLPINDVRTMEYGFRQLKEASIISSSRK